MWHTALRLFLLPRFLGTSLACPCEPSTPTGHKFLSCPFAWRISKVRQKPFIQGTNWRVSSFIRMAMSDKRYQSGSGIAIGFFLLQLCS
jgi:hypothetical protein